MKTTQTLFFVFLSFIVVAFGQPAWVAWLGPIAAVIGYAIFWNILESSGVKRSLRAVYGFFWYMGVQFIQLSWMTSIEYQGYYILFVYALIAMWYGAQFGLFTYFLFSRIPLSFLRITALAGLWTILEWSRFYTICGFPWNPIGMALGSYSVSMQMAACTGILGLSFWVMLTNLVALKELWSIMHLRRGFMRWTACALVPYIFGSFYLAYHTRAEQKMGFFSEKVAKVALVQTGLLPSEKSLLPGRQKEYISPWLQWQRIFTFLKNAQIEGVSLIVLPEYTVPFSAGLPLFSEEGATALLEKIFGTSCTQYFPPLQRPFSETKIHNGVAVTLVSNAFFSQFLANFFHADVVIGMDDRDFELARSYSAGLHFTPGGSAPCRYEKRVLLPLAEYVPFDWCKNMTASYGITEFYTHGKEAKVFANLNKPFSLSICYEEAFPEMVRDGRLNGAELFINLTNDNWYPNSRLAKQHFDHGRLRSIENGTPLLRACNSGITAVINARGQVVNIFDEEVGVLIAKIPQYNFSTLYTRYGDALIIGCSFGFILAHFLFSKELRRKKKNRKLT